MTDIKSVVQKAQKTKLDGVENISKAEYEQIRTSFRNDAQSPESLKWLAEKHPQLHASLTSGLDYSGYVGTAVGSLNSTRAGDDLWADAARREAKLDRLPARSEYRENGLPRSVTDGGTPYGTHPETNEAVVAYKTGSNTTYVYGDKLKVSDADAATARQAQRDYCAKMSGVIGTDIPNPPSINAAKGYFQTLANNGASQDQIRKEYDQYLKTFYKHPGGVEWDPKLDPKNLDRSFSQQPVGKDGRRLIDCEGYSALTESVLGGIKKGGQPMFDIQHGTGPGHIITGVFPHGGDPRQGFIVSNDSASPVKFDERSSKDYAATQSAEARQRYLVREHWRTLGDARGAPTAYGDTITDLSPPGGKIPGR